TNAALAARDIAWSLAHYRMARPLPAFARISPPLAPRAVPPNLTASKSRNADCRCACAPAYCSHEIIPAKRARNELVADRRLLFNRLRALYALPCHRAINRWTCLPGRADYMAVRYTAAHHRAFHVFGFCLVFVHCCI